MHPKADIELLIKNGRKARVGPCVWITDAEINDFWKPSCIGWWEHCEGTPSDHGMKFCPYCGRTIEVKEATVHER